MRLTSVWCWSNYIVGNLTPRLSGKNYFKDDFTQIEKDGVMLAFLQSGSAGGIPYWWEQLHRSTQHVLLKHQITADQPIPKVLFIFHVICGNFWTNWHWHTMVSRLVQHHKTPDTCYLCCISHLGVFDILPQGMRFKISVFEWRHICKRFLSCVWMYLDE